jgi:hypothetical protein
MVNGPRKITEKELLEVFNRVVREDHPNPERVSCPGRTALEQLAAAPAEGVSIEEQVLLHIGVCSPCLKELMELRGRQKGKPGKM